MDHLVITQMAPVSTISDKTYWLLLFFYSILVFCLNSTDSIRLGRSTLECIGLDYYIGKDNIGYILMDYIQLD